MPLCCTFLNTFVQKLLEDLSVFSAQSQQIEINFVRQGGHVNAIGAFVEGVKRKTDK